MSKKNTVSIGIPAYNEEANIGFLMDDLINQKQKKILIEKIIIFSDSSTDKTIEIVKSINYKKILILNNRKRAGLAAGQNRIIKNTDSDTLVLLNADIRIKDSKFLEKLISPITVGQADLVAPHVEEVKSQSFFEKILLTSTQLKNQTYEEFNQGKNVYTCHGQARAFSKRLYKKIHFPFSIGEDAYSYFYCISNGFKYQYVKDINVLYKLPDNFLDHEKQSIRFFQSQKFLAKKFNRQFVTSEYNIPKILLIKSVLTYLMKQPIHTILYILIAVYLNVRSYFYKSIGNTWEISKTSKKLSI